MTDDLLRRRNWLFETRPTTDRAEPVVPELLIAATVGAAVRIHRDGLPAALVLSERTHRLVVESLRGM
ncbi:MAG: hypothetical protein AB7K24_31940 [Gemmataceae bacterium]